VSIESLMSREGDIPAFCLDVYEDAEEVVAPVLEEFIDEILVDVLKPTREEICEEIKRQICDDFERLLLLMRPCIVSKNLFLDDIIASFKGARKAVMSVNARVEEKAAEVLADRDVMDVPEYSKEICLFCFRARSLAVVISHQSVFYFSDDPGYLFSFSPSVSLPSCFLRDFDDAGTEDVTSVFCRVRSLSFFLEPAKLVGIIREDEDVDISLSDLGYLRNLLETCTEDYVSTERNCFDLGQRINDSLKGLPGSQHKDLELRLEELKRRFYDGIVKELNSSKFWNKWRVIKKDLLYFKRTAQKYKCKIDVLLKDLELIMRLVDEDHGYSEFHPSHIRDLFTGEMLHITTLKEFARVKESYHEYHKELAEGRARAIHALQCFSVLESFLHRELGEHQPLGSLRCLRI
jgi:hypothetical protein